MPWQAWLVISVAIVFVGGLLPLMTLPARISLEASDRELIVRPLGLDRMWCVRSRVAIAWPDITAIEAAHRDSLPKPGIRLPGAYMPGLITAGSYGLGENRMFWDVRRAARVLVISCRPGTRYRQLVLEVPDPDAVATRCGSNGAVERKRAARIQADRPSAQYSTAPVAASERTLNSRP